MPGGATTNKLTVFVNGNLNITGNVTYAGSPWASPSAIPYLTVVTCGDIYINSGVTELNGWYIALPKSACGPGVGGGTIYTCTSGFAFVAPINMYGTCGGVLTVRGSFSADRIKFLRTHGSLLQGPVGEGIGGSNISEKFIYGAQSWLGQPVQKVVPPSTASTKIESITGLPPVL